MTIIPLAPPSLTGSSSLPGGWERAVPLTGAGGCPPGRQRPPIWPCSVRGFACHPCCHGRGALLPHLFTLTLRRTAGFRQPLAQGGMFSVPLSFELPRPGVPRRTALRSSDFPPFDERVERRSSGALRLPYYPSDSWVIAYCSSFL